MASRLTITKDTVSEVVGAINELVGKQVLIGYPDSGKPRQSGDPVNNATIAYVMETGMPASNVPARPTLVPGVKKATPRALVSLQEAATATLDANPKKADQALNQAGLIGMNEVMRQINSNVPPPLAPSTVRGRKYARGTKSRRKSEEKYLALVKGGAAPGDAQTAAGIVALVNTAQMRNAVTYVVRKKAK